MTKLKNDWYVCSIDKKLLRSLSKRSDKPALIWFGSYFLLLALMGTAVVLAWGSWWAWLFAIAYWAIWGCAASGFHETCHKTPFRTRWLNETALWAFGWMVQMEPIAVRWGHLGHHSFTHFNEGDTELSEPNPVTWGLLFKVGSGLGGTYFYSKFLVAQAFGFISDEMREVIPSKKVPQAINNARIMVGPLCFCDHLGAVSAILAADCAYFCRQDHWRSRDRSFASYAAYLSADEREGPPLFNAQFYGRSSHPFLLFQHELSRGASHVPDGAVLQSATTERGIEKSAAGTL